MEKQACRGLVDLVGPLTYDLADAILTPGLPKRKPKYKKRVRQATSSESSAEKPIRTNPKMASTTGQVAEKVASINNASAATSGNVDSDGQSSSGHVAPPGHQQARVGKQGEQFCKEFCKMSTVKKGLRDDKDERNHRKNISCHYDALAENKFVGTIRTTESLLPTLKPTEVVGIIMAHYSYKDSFIEAIIGDLESVCRTKTEVQCLDNSYMDEAKKVEENFPKVMDLFFTDPTEKLKTITTFKNNIVSEEYLRDHKSMDAGLKHIINTILSKSKTYLRSFQEGEKEWGQAVRKSYNGAVTEAVYPNPQMGSSLELDIATSLNLDSCHKNRSAVASLSVTQVNLGKQVAALSKAVIADKLDRIEEVLVI